MALRSGRVFLRRYSVDKYSPNALCKRSIRELEDLIERRSSLSTHEILDKLHHVSQMNVQLPLRYYQNSLDVCAHRGDFDSAAVVLRLAGEPSSHPRLASLHFTPLMTSEINMHTEASQIKEVSPYLDLLWYAITKFTAYGYFDLVAPLWDSALRSDPKPMKDNLFQVVEKIFTKQYLNPVSSLELIRQRSQSDRWNENSQFYQALSNTLDRYLTRRLQDRSPPNILDEANRLEELIAERILNTPPPPSPLLDHRAVETGLELFKSRYLLGLCSLSRFYSTVDQNQLNQFYEQATESFHAALLLPSSSSSGTGASPTALQIRSNRLSVDSGDVVKEILDKKVNLNIGKTSIEYKLLDLLSSELTALSRYASCPTEANSYQLKTTSASHLSAAQIRLLEQNLPHSGAEGGNYRMNFEVETHRSVMVQLMDEMPRHVQTVDPIFHHLQAYLTRFYSHLLPEKTSRPSPPLIPLPYSDAEIRTPPVHSFIVLGHLYSLARAHSQRLDTSTTRPINPLKTSDQFYLRNLFSQTIFNARYLRLHIPRPASSDEDEDEDRGDSDDLTSSSHYNQSMLHLSDPSLVLSSRDYPNYFHALENYGERLIDLAERCGVRLDAHFYANWILAFPLCQLDHTIPTPWKYTSSEFLSSLIRRGLNEIRGSQLSHSVKQQQMDVIHHALICHLCSYGSQEAIDYAYETACQMYGSRPGSSASLPVDIWNTLLTTAAKNCTGKFVAPLLRAAQASTAASSLQMPSSSLEVAYFRALEKFKTEEAEAEEGEESAGELPELLDDHTLTQLIQMNYSTLSQSSEQEVEGIEEAQQLVFDSNLAKALLMGHLLTKEKYHSLRLLKSLQYHGYRSPLSLYRRLIHCFLFHKENSDDPMDNFIPSHPHLTASVVHEMMCRDGIKFDDATTLSPLVELFLYPAQHLGVPVNLFDNLRQARHFLVDSCEAHQLVPNEQLIRVFLDLAFLTSNRTGGGLGGHGSDEQNNFIISQFLSLVNSHNERLQVTSGDASSSSVVATAKRAPLLPTLAMLKMLPASGRWSDTENGISGSAIVERWVEIWAAQRTGTGTDPSSDFDEVIRLISERYAVAPSLKALKKLLAKEIKAKNSPAANKVGALYLSVYSDLEKREAAASTATSSLSPSSSTRLGSLEHKLQTAHGELQQLFEGYEIPFEITLLGRHVRD
jgi:hypothetical protein